MVPPIAVMLSKSELVDRYDLSCVRYINCGSAPLSSGVEAAVKRRLGPGLYIGQGEPIVLRYGLSETSSVLTQTPRLLLQATV